MNILGSKLGNGLLDFASHSCSEAGYVVSLVSNVVVFNVNVVAFERRRGAEKISSNTLLCSRTMDLSGDLPKALLFT